MIINGLVCVYRSLKFYSILKLLNISGFFVCLFVCLFVVFCCCYFLFSLIIICFLLIFDYISIV